MTQTREERAVYRRAYYLAHRQEALERQRAYNAAHPKVDRDLAAHREQIARSRDRYPDHWRARVALGYAVRSGRLTRGPCETCGDGPTEGHHHLGYAREHWLSVTWLCRAHHKQIHRIAA